MAIRLITGVPGAGKTTLLIDMVEKERYLEIEGKKIKRDVYYFNINELKTDWKPLERPSEWVDVPKGSIIVLDECQDCFPVLKIGEQKPEYYSRLAKHRHQGLDIYLVTQDPGLIDAFVRKLVEHHYHLKRKFGAPMATMFTSASGGAFNVQNDLWKQDKSIYKYPKEVQELYHSAELHTVKKKIPKAVYFFPFALITFGLCIWLIIGVFKKFNTDDEPTESASLTERFVPTSRAANHPNSNIPTRKLNTLITGPLAGSKIYYLGHLNERMIFEVDGSILQGRALKRIGYDVVHIDRCLATVSLIAVSCKSVIKEEKEENIAGGGGEEGRSTPPPAPLSKKTVSINDLKVYDGRYVLPGISSDIGNEKPAKDSTYKYKPPY